MSLFCGLLFVLVGAFRSIVLLFSCDPRCVGASVFSFNSKRKGTKRMPPVPRLFPYLSLFYAVVSTGHPWPGKTQFASLQIAHRKEG